VVVAVFTTQVHVHVKASPVSAVPKDDEGTAQYCIDRYAWNLGDTMAQGRWMPLSSKCETCLCVRSRERERLAGEGKEGGVCVWGGGEG